MRERERQTEREREDEVISAVWLESLQMVDVAQRTHTKSSTSLCVTSYCVQECTVNTHTDHPPAIAARPTPEHNMLTTK